jgi:hypothetical protein
MHRERFGDQDHAVFEVPLPDRQSVFMRFHIARHMNDSSAVVIVDTDKFLALWRKEPHSIHREQAHGNPSTWPNDRKYALAAQGFSYGSGNPVPLAHVSFDTGIVTKTSYTFLKFGKKVVNTTVPFVMFSNGVTRTIWLLTNGCLAFPIECELPRATELFRRAGAPGSRLLTMNDLYRLPEAATGP